MSSSRTPSCSDAEMPHRWAVGVDLSLTSTAIAAKSLTTDDLHVTRIRSAGRKDDPLEAHISRMDALATKIVAAVRSVNPELVVIEDMMFGTTRDTSAHRRSGLWWMVASLLRHHRVPMIAAPPSTLKKWATGKGNAGKDMVLASAVRRWPQVITQNDEADAAWLSDIADYLATSRGATKTKDAILVKLGGPTFPLPMLDTDNTSSAVA